MKYAVMSREGVRRAVSGTTVLELAAGDSVTLDFEGFENGSQARAWIVPGDILLGRATLAGGKGTVTGGVPLGSQAGERRIVSEAKSADGKAVVVAFGVKVTNGDAGGTPWSLIFLLVVGMAVTAGLLVPAARRKRDED